MRQTEREYAEALFGLCCEEGILRECLSDMNTVKEAFLEYPQYGELLASPAIPLSERLSVIDEAFSGRICDYSVSFLKLLCEKGRIGVLIGSIGEFEALCKAYFGKKTAYITSAVELDGEQKRAICEKLERAHKAHIDPVWSVDPSVMGGVLVEMDGKVYDGTLRSRLRSVKEVMMDEQTQ
ncbi:MAG: ATP synthase F1 subunit delta [Ruminococcaceae bacterium]|nr:ATP synthase F1 subunit delta [Oscillospiraceae bacterium]